MYYLIYLLYNNQDGRTPLHHAACYGRESIVSVLLGAGAIINETDEVSYFINIPELSLFFIYFIRLI